MAVGAGRVMVTEAGGYLAAVGLVLVALCLAWPALAWPAAGVGAVATLMVLDLTAHPDRNRRGGTPGV